MSWALVIREFLHELFGSRLNQRLEEDLLRLRSDFDARLLEKDQIIATLRTDIAVLQAKIVIYENTILPHVSRIGADVVSYQRPRDKKTLEKPTWSMADVPKIQTSWQADKERMEKELREEASKGNKEVPANA